MFSNRRKVILGIVSSTTLFLSVGITSCVQQPQASTNTPDLAEGNSDATAVSDKAGKDSITVYTALEDDQISEYLPLFKQENPDVNVNIVRDSTGIVTAKLIAEKGNPQADVVWGLAASSLLVADEEGMLQPYAPKGVDTVLPKMKDDRTPPHWVGIDAWMSAFCANTVELKKKGVPVPQSWDDLTKPEYKNMIVMSNPASSGTGFLSVSAILQLKGEEKGWQYLDALNQNVAQYMHSGSKPCKAAGAGEYPIGVSFDYRAVKQKNDGEPIEAVFPKEGSGWDIEANALVKKDNVKPEAKQFLNWAISPEVSEKYAENFAITGTKTNVKAPEGYPPDPTAQLIKNDFNWAAQNRDRILEEWTSRYDSKSEPKEE